MTLPDRYNLFSGLSIAYITREKPAITANKIAPPIASFTNAQQKDP